MEDRNWWWVVKRDGTVAAPESQPERDENSPPLVDDSPFTPSFYLENGELPGAHLHHLDGQIIEIHAQGTLEELRNRLAYFVAHEEQILAVEPEHWFDLPIEDAQARIS